MPTTSFILKSVLYCLVWISYVDSSSIRKPNHFIGIQMRQEEKVSNDATSNKTFLIHFKERIKTANATNSSKIIKPPLEKGTLNQSPNQEEAKRPKETAWLVNEELNTLNSDIANILDNIQLLGSQLISTASSTKEILKDISELQNDFAKMQFELITDSNNKHKKIGQLNERLSLHLNEQLSHQLFILNKTEEEIRLIIKEDEADLSKLKYDIFSNSKCSSYQSCSQCSSDSSCGWCLSTEKCIEGDYNGPLFAQCSDYSFSICDQSAICSQVTCAECIANLLCQWCAYSPKPFCSKVTEGLACTKELTVNLLGDNPICPMVNYKMKYQGGNQHDILKENMNFAKRREQRMKYDSITQKVKLSKMKIEELNNQRQKIEDEIALIKKEKDDFNLVEEELIGKGYNDALKKKMMELFREDLKIFLANLRKKLTQQ